MPTLKELGKTLNLSAMAVSKALRDSPDISAATKARVLAEAQRLHYVPNQAARNLRLRRSRLLGVIVPNINNTYYSNIVWGIQQQAEPEGFEILLGHSLDQGPQEAAEARRMLARQAEGLLIVPAVRWQNRFGTLEILEQAGVPAVLLDRYPAGAERFSKVSWVASRDEQGAALAVSHLLALGHRKILFLAGPNGSSSSAARFSGYRKCLAGAGIEPDDKQIFLAGGDIESGEKAMAQALSEGVSFTAVVAFNDSTAIGAVNVLQQQGFSVPDDVSVTGFGGGVLSANFRVPLTTVRIPQVEIGSAAVRLLLGLIAGAEAHPRELPVELLVRQSTAPRKEN